MTVRENVELAAEAALSGPYRSLRLWRRVSPAARERAADALERTRLADRADAPAVSLPHGGKR
jgi:branched-chain amino acid transport system ATP-binding protein